jgi:IS1 family transposase
MQSLKLDHIQVDEIWTYCGKKQSRLTTTEQAERSDIGDIYFWVAFDQTTKLIPTFVVGKRSADNARRLMMDLASRLVWPSVVESDARNFHGSKYPAVTQLSTDGFNVYPEAVDLAFSRYIKYGTIVKDFRNAVMPYTPSEMVAADRRRRVGDFDPRTICTSHVERNNATIRLFIKRFSRLTLCFSKKLENLAAAIALHTAHYNFCRRHGTLRVTPAMAANVTDRLWNLEDLLKAVW